MQHFDPLVALREESRYGLASDSGRLFKFTGASGRRGDPARLPATLPCHFLHKLQRSRLAGTGIALRGYRLLGEETPVVDIDARILSPQRWALTLSWPDGSTRQVQLAGDDWRVEAVVLKWKLPALLAGLPPLYRLDRLSGRYDDPAQEASAPRTVISLGTANPFDLLTLGRRYPQWLPEVDTVYGSGAFLPLVDQGHYSISLMRTGALLARPDDATAQRIGSRFGG